jgi:pyruvate formate lyase activating enzyme
VHSVETGGTVDGPGLRYVVFLQGCPLRCKFCHNPDTWEFNKGKLVTSGEVVEDILKYRNFIKSGGVTLSGGEPLAQPVFAAEILEQCARENIHTAVDTSGAVPLAACKRAVDAAGLILLDIKHIESRGCMDISGQGNENALELLEYCEQTKKDVWIRHVVLPGFTDDLAALEKMAEYLSRYTVVKRVEILPFHKMGEYKWKQLNLKYDLENTPEPPAELIRRIKEIFRKHNLNAA